MREKIKRLSHGEFDYEILELMVSGGKNTQVTQEAVEFNAEAGRIFNGSFKIENSKGKKMKGIVYCDSFSLSVKNPVFDSEESEIFFELNTDSLRVGESIKIPLFIISELGEKKLLLRAVITAKSYPVSMGNIRDLFHFANLAGTDWQEALRVFKSPDFISVFLYKDIKNTMIYQGLIKSRSADHALEEFLISIHKKSRVNLYLDEDKKIYKDPEVITEDKVTLRRSQWGYVKIQVSADADFIIPEYKTIWQESFIKDKYYVKYTVDPQKMTGRNQEGNLIFTTQYQTLKLAVTVKRDETALNTKKDEEKYKFKHIKAGAVKNYLNFRLGNLTLEAYEKRMENLLSQITGKREEWYGIYLRIQMALLTGKGKTASQLLLNCDHRFSKSRFGVFPAPEYHEALKGEKELSVEEYCTYVYFKTLFLRKKSVTERAVEIINEFYGQGYEDSFLFWFLIYLDTKYETNPSLTVREIMEYITAGSTSPVLYYEVLSRYRKKPELLRDLGTENLLIMSFASRYGALKGELLGHFLHKAGMVKSFNPLLYQILKRIYRESPNVEVLSVTVQMLIKGHKTEPEYFTWYEDGVKENLNITELYEYYIASVDWSREPDIPEVVFSYFRYHRKMPGSRKVMFYHYIVEKAGKLPDVYKNYAEDIKEFAKKELEAGNANPVMGTLYEKALSEGEISRETALGLPRLMFLYELTTKEEDIEGIYVRHKELDEEKYYPLSSSQGVRRVIFTAATENCCIFLEDRQGNRYLNTRSYNIKKLFDFEKYAPEIAAAGSVDTMFLLYILEQTESYHKNIVEDTVLYGRLSGTEGVNKDVLRRCDFRLMKNYYDQFAVELLDDCLRKTDLSIYSFGERKTLMEYLMIRDLTAIAIEAVKTYGSRGLNPKRVMRLCSKILQKEKDNGWIFKKKEDYKFTEIAFLAFKEVQCDQIVIEYLERYYCGDTENMVKLWNAVSERGLSGCNLGERILSQVLFSEGSLTEVFPVFKEYYKNGDNRRLVKAYLNYSSYKYLVFDRVLLEEIFKYIEEEVIREPEDVMVLALLKYYSKKENLGEQQLKTADYQIGRMIDKNLVLPFFRNFKGKVLMPQSILNKYYVEYRTNPSHKVTLHYYMDNKENGGSYCSVEMKHVYGGIFVKEFLLFYGEELLYYITEEGEDGDNITESIRIKQENLDEEDENQYNTINLMLVSRQMQDEKTMLELMENYIRTEYSTKLFRPIDD